MSFDLYENENLDAVSSMPPVQDVPAGFFGGMEYIPNLAMRSAAVAGRATSLLASAPLVLLDRIKGDTSLEDRYFKQHEDVYQRAVDYWTPKPNEVGTAAQLVGDMLFTLPTAIAAPPIALGSAYAGTAEDLVRQGVDPTQAQAVGGVQSAGLALGLWMPILGKNLWQRTVVGGAGFNALQGIATRGASQAILSDTEAKDQFHAFDGEALTLDVLMGLGFGTFAHLSPEQRAQGEATWNKVAEWAQQMSPSQKAAIATLREAQHLNVDSVPGKPVDPVDVEAHVNRMRQAIDQLVNDQPVQVSDLPEPKLEADLAREAQTQENYRNLADAAEQVRQDEGIPQVSEVGKTITERLMDIGVPPQEAADKGLLWDSFFKSMSDKTGQDAQQLFGKYFDRVFSSEQAQGDVLMQQQEYKGTPNTEYVPDANFISEAKAHFGVTRDPREAGYILPDGTMLDFTGRHYSSDHPSLRGQRAVDHRELTGENSQGHSLDDLFSQDSGSGNNYMHEFMARTGAMRVDFNAKVASTMRAPTPEQLLVLGQNLKGDWSAVSYIDPVNGRIVGDSEFERTTPATISKFFAEHAGKDAPPNAALFQSATPQPMEQRYQTETPEFQNWFGDSKVVDADGKPLVVYHGTSNDFSEFKNKYANRSWEMFSDSSEYSNRFASNRGGRLVPVYLSIRNPLDLRSLPAIRGDARNKLIILLEDAGVKYGNNFKMSDLPYERDLFQIVNMAGHKSGFADAVTEAGYDGIIMPDNHDGDYLDDGGIIATTYIALFPTQIKSAIGNRGTFDPNDPNILHQGSRGFLQLGSRMSIGLLSSADKSTFLHESGHFFLEVMNDLSKEVPDLRADMDTVREWMGIKGDTAEARAEAWNAMTLEEKRPFHEQWARGFEQYLMDGKAPNEQLKGAFERFRDWLIEIYKSATALNVKVSNEVRQVMDRMLDSQAKAAQEPSGDVVPPPRAIAGEAPGSDLDKVLADGMPNLENHKPLSDPDIQGMVQDMALNEAGWAEKGGYLIRSWSEVAGEEQISRTKWVPKAEWWPDRPAQGKRRLNEAQIQEAVRKAIAGEPLKPLEQSTVDYMTAIANDRIQGVDQIGWEEFGRAMDDVIAHGEEPTTENVFDYEAMVRAIELNPEAAKSAQEAYDIHNDDAVFMAEIRSIIDEKVQQATQSVPGSDGEGGAEPAKPAEQPDPITAEAARIAQSSPDVRIEVGTDESGQPITKSIQEYLDDAKAGADQARKDVSLIQAAAECLLGSL